jgi:hypothetical protein
MYITNDAVVVVTIFVYGALLTYCNSPFFTKNV